MVDLNMVNTEEIKALERSISNAKHLIELGASLERLRNNRDFIKVVNDGYFKEEAIRLVHLKADPSMQSVQSQESIIKQLDAIGAFNQYCTQIFQNASLAARSISADEETLEDFLAGEV